MRSGPEGSSPGPAVPVIEVRVDADPAVLDRAVPLLEAGALIIFPTETLYALGGRALDPEVGRRVRKAKGRPESKPLPVVAAGLGQARGLCEAWSPLAERLAHHFWPGPLTLVLPASPELPDAVTSGTRTVAVRVPGRELARLLSTRAGPLISTSANRGGERPPLTCAEAVAAVGSWAALALDGGPGRGTVSTIVDLTGPSAALLRAGAIDWAEVLAVLR